MVPQEDGSITWVTEEAFTKYREMNEAAPEERTENFKFLLYTPEKGDTPEEISSSYAFNTTRDTRFIIHGWKNTFESDVNVLVRKAYNDVGSYNVIVVDWSHYAKRTYVYASNQVRRVATKVAGFIDNSTLPVDRIEIVGHSLGAHCAGLSARYVTKGRIPVVWGLDPAGPLFSVKDPSWRISNIDALYVECIHTNAGTLGFTEPLGISDFYVNGGKSQPGCGLDLSGSCSHSRSYQYFAESIRANKFKSCICKDYKNAMKSNCEVESGSAANMGYGSRNLKGCYHTPVNKKSPFAKG